MKTIDLRKMHRTLYTQRRGTATIVDVPPMLFLMIDGKGNPTTSSAFQDSVGALYSLAYTMKFMVKKGKKPADYPVMPLEGLWWAEDMRSFERFEKEKWEWTLMVLVPDVITQATVNEAAELVRKKKSPQLLDRIRLERFDEGRAAQVLHIGPYENEAPTIEALHAFIRDNGARLRGKHHEIYFGDPRRGNPANLKTILRQPIAE
jgi:hypothetical protein